MMLTIHRVVKTVALLTCLLIPLVRVTNSAYGESVIHGDDGGDRMWVINTRRISSQVSCADLDLPQFDFARVNPCGGQSATSLDDYVMTRAEGRRTIVYVHGNRMESCDAIERGIEVYRSIMRHRDFEPLDWVIFSWPSEQVGILTHDVRLKAERTDAQGLYLAWLLRKHYESGTPTTLIGYSFGSRVITGSLHALAGGNLGGRTLPGTHVVGMNVEAGLVAPAIASNWMSQGGYHGLATKNLDHLSLYYNQKDAVLKRYWLIDRVRGQLALGYTGPRSFAPRVDGSKLPVIAKDCSPVVGLQHVEMDYYQPPCHAGLGMADLISNNHLGF